MPRKPKHALLLAPMDKDELERCFRIIYAERLPANPFRLLAEDLNVEFETVISWGTLIPFPSEIACGLRVRAAIMSGEMAPTEETVLSLMNLKLVLRWIFERASGSDVVKLFGELGRRLHEKRQEA